VSSGFSFNSLSLPPPSLSVVHRTRKWRFFCRFIFVMIHNSQGLSLSWVYIILVSKFEVQICEHDDALRIG
jgi:hypothetical protein